MTIREQARELGLPLHNQSYSENSGTRDANPHVYVCICVYVYGFRVRKKKF